MVGNYSLFYHPRFADVHTIANSTEKVGGSTLRISGTIQAVNNHAPSPVPSISGTEDNSETKGGSNPLPCRSVIRAIDKSFCRSRIGEISPSGRNDKGDLSFRTDVRNLLVEQEFLSLTIEQ